MPLRGTTMNENVQAHPVNLVNPVEPVTVQISGTKAGLHAEFIQHVPTPNDGALPAVWHGRPRQILTPKSEQLLEPTAHVDRRDPLVGNSRHPTAPFSRKTTGDPARSPGRGWQRRERGRYRMAGA